MSYIVFNFTKRDNEMKKKALRSNRNRHTGKINAYKKGIINNKLSIIKYGYATLTTRHTTPSQDGKWFNFTTDQTVRV